MATVATLPQRVNNPSVSRGPLADGWASILAAGGVPVVVKPGTNEAKFPDWQKRRGWKPETLAQIAAKYPQHNVGISCGASGITVVDIDSADVELLRYVLEELGDTPLKVRTPRGWHLYYRATGETCFNFKDHPEPAWRKPQIQVKGRGGQVVAPPSIRPTGNYELFRLDDWISFADLPTLPPEHPALAPCRAASRGKNVERLRPGSAERIRAGGRSDALFQHVLQALGPYNGAPEDQVRARALAVATEFVQTRIDPDDGHAFTDADINRAIDWPIRRTVEGQNWHGFKGGTRGRLQSDIERLAGDADAFLMLALLRETHAPGARFTLSPKGMVKHNLIPGWGLRRYRNAIKTLGLTFVRCVKQGGARGVGDASLYEWR